MVAQTGFAVRKARLTTALQTAKATATYRAHALAAVSLGSVEPSYRYLHPFSFTGLAAVALLLEITATRHPAEKIPSLDKVRQAGADSGPAAQVSVPPAGTV